MTNLNPRQLERLIQSHLIIENKQARLVRFLLNKVQRTYNLNQTLRDIILKARQFGFTSLILAEFAIESLLIDNLRTVIMAHDALSTRLMLRRVSKYLQRFYIDEELRPIETIRENANEITIKETGSTIYIGTAGSRKFGRGDTVNRLLLSEIAKYDDPDEVFTGVLQAVPMTGRTVMETTANGFNFFRPLYYDAKAGRSNYKAHFFPWFLHDEYQMAGPAIAHTEEEIALVTKFPQITDAQLRWRRWKKSEPGFVKDPTLFQQEYPATDHEAFISSGNTVFNTMTLEQMLKNVKPPIFKGNVDVSGQISDDRNGNLWLWQFADPRKSYVIFGDPAEGLARGDYCAGVVMEYNTAEVVAVWHGHIDPDQFGRVLVGMGRYYREGLLGIETNNHGIATIITARDLGYENLYRRVVYDQSTDQETVKLGWKTDVVSKPVMINDMKAAVRDGLVKIPDERIILQLIAYEEKEPASESTEYRRLGAPTGEHDDLVIAVSGAFQMRKYSAPTSTDDVPTNYLDHARKQRQQRLGS